MSPEIYQEDIYSIPEKLIIALSESWSSLSDESRNMLHNLSSGLKIIPSPRFVTCGGADLTDELFQNKKVLAFGHDIKGIEPHKPVVHNGVQILLTKSPEEFHGNSELKKELWAAIQILLSL
jgi:hypothetical protein